MKHREAEYYKLNKDGDAECYLCPHNCILKDSILSMCGTRVLMDSKLRTLSYGNAEALNSDPVEKKPLFHFMPGTKTLSIGTKGCNMKCRNCQNSTLSQSKISIDDKKEITPEMIVKTAIANKISSISYTYNEPVVFYEYMKETAILAKENDLSNIMVSNGYVSVEPLNELIPYLDAVNIDMKSFDDEVYRKLTGADREHVLRNIRLLHKSGIHLEITLLIIPNISDSEHHLKSFFRWMIDGNMESVPIHISRFFPTYKLPDSRATEIEEVLMIRKLALDTGIKYVYPGNISSHDSLNTYCPQCNTILISRTGYLTEKKYTSEGNCPECGFSLLKTNHL